MYIIVHDHATTLIVLVRVNFFPNSIVSHGKVWQVPVNPSEMLKLEKKKEGSLSSSTKVKEKVIQPIPWTQKNFLVKI